MHVGGWCAQGSTPGNYGLGIEPKSVYHCGHDHPFFKV